MTDAIIWAVALVAVTAMICIAVLRGWRGWLELRRHELAEHAANDDTGGSPVVLIELAGMKERLRKLEAIAKGVDL